MDHNKWAEYIIDGIIVVIIIIINVINNEIVDKAKLVLISKKIIHDDKLQLYRIHQ